MTIIVYQDSKLYTDTTAFTDYSGAVAQVKWQYANLLQMAHCYAGVQEDISYAVNRKAYPGYIPTELAVVSLYKLGEAEVLTYRENAGITYPVIVSDERPIFFGNNALCVVAKNYMNTVYTWDEPLLVAMVKAGVFPAVVELSPVDGYHYLHKFSGSEELPDTLNLRNAAS